MSNSRTIRVSAGFGWFTCWLFTLAFAHLTLGQAVIALIVWPYYLGDAIATLVGAR